MDGAGRLAEKLRPQADLKAAAIGAAVLLREYLGSARAAKPVEKKPAKRPVIDREPPRPGVVAWIERNVPRRAAFVPARYAAPAIATARSSCPPRG